MKAFITGSQAYGSPTSKSDVDLVVYCDSETKQKLIELSDAGKMPCIFGKLNLIFATNEQTYKAWAEAKEICEVMKPLTQEEACLVHDKIRNKYGITYDHDSGEHA